ncbi:gustatory receptor [Homalodisca vitripennis]|nr:gustatory receptor [Homalodisca vitripennis]
MALLYCHVFTGFPLKYVLESAGVIRLIFSTSMFWWSLTLFLLELGFGCFEIYMKFVQNPSVIISEIESTTSILALSLIEGSALLMGLTMFINYATKYPHYLEVCNLLEKFDQTLQLVTPEYCNTVKLPIIIPSTIAPVVFEGIDMYLTSQKEEHELIVRRIMAYIVIILVYCGRTGMLILFNQVAYSMAKRFKLINVRIREVVISERLRHSILSQNPTICNHRLSCISCKKTKPLMSAYHTLCDAMNEANGFYGNLLLTYILFTFIDITELLYLFIYFFQNVDKIVLCSIGAAIFSDASFLMLVAVSSSGVSEAAGETASLIRKQINMEMSSDLREQLKSTLLQLLNKRVEFSSAGFFQINKQTLTSITAAVTTYLVIMLQFQSQFS